MGISIYLDGTTGLNDGILETPGDGIGIELSEIGSVSIFHLRAPDGTQTSESVLVMAPTDCSVSVDGTEYGASAYYEAGAIQGRNVPCYVKRVTNTQTEPRIETQLRTTPHCNLVKVESLFSGGTGTISEPYILATVNDWNYAVANGNYASSNFKLANDIDFAGGTMQRWAWNVGFSGSLDGNGKRILNGVCSVDGTSTINNTTACLILSVSGSVHDLEVSNCNFSMSGADGQTATVFGSISGTVENVKSANNTLNTDFSNGTSTGFAQFISGTVSKCSCEANTVNAGAFGFGFVRQLNSSSASVSECRVKGGSINKLGSVLNHIHAGFCYLVNTGAVISNCYVSDILIQSGTNHTCSGFIHTRSNSYGGTVSNSYASVSFTQPHANADGWNFTNTQTANLGANCLWDKDTSADTSEVSGATGLTSLQLKSTSGSVLSLDTGNSPAKWVFSTTSYPELVYFG